MGSADVVVAKLLNLVHHTGDASLVGSRSHSTQVMMVGHALQEYFLAVQPETILAGKLHGADAEALTQAVDGLTVEHQRHLGSVQVGGLTPPQLWFLHRHLGQQHLHRRLLVVLRGGDAGLCHLLAVGAVDDSSYREVVLLVLDAFHFYLHADRSLLLADLRCLDIDTVAGYRHRVFQHQMDIAEQTAAGIPT